MALCNVNGKLVNLIQSSFNLNGWMPKLGMVTGQVCGKFIISISTLITKNHPHPRLHLQFLLLGNLHSHRVTGSHMDSPNKTKNKK